jgi:hypothetical protein
MRGGTLRIPGWLSVLLCGSLQFADCKTVEESVTGERLGWMRNSVA